MQKLGLSLLILFSGVVMLGGQTIEKTVIGTAGQTSANANIHLNWTMGETAVQVITHSHGQWQEGFHSSGIQVEAVPSRPQTFLTDLQLSFAPNPVKNEFNVKFYSSELTSAKLLLLDLSGKPMQRPLQLQMDQSMTVDITGLNPGIYLIQLTSQNGKLLRTAKLSKF